ncbi:unnamed protein product, partial [Didymodactylos carnosus]
QPHLNINEDLFVVNDDKQNPYLYEFIHKINSYLDNINHITKDIFHKTNIFYWHSSTLLQQTTFSSSSYPQNFIYDDDTDENPRQNDETTSTLTPAESTAVNIEQNGDDLFTNDEITFYSYLKLKNNRTVLTTAMINSGHIYEFYKLTSFSRHTCVQILLNLLCNQRLLPDDGTCCAQVPPLTRLQFLMSLLLGLLITLFIIYIVYRIRATFLFRRKKNLLSPTTAASTASTTVVIDNQEQTSLKMSNGHILNNDGPCLLNGRYSEMDNHQVSSTMNGNVFSQQRSQNYGVTSVPHSAPILPTTISRYRFFIPKFLRTLRKKSQQHLLPPLLLTTSIATQQSTSNSSSSSSSLYPSRFYKKKNSLFHFPLTDPYVLRTITKYSFILLYFYLSDRTDFWMKENLHFTRVAFFLPLTYIGVLGIFFHDKLQQLSPLSSPLSSSSASPSHTPTSGSPPVSFSTEPTTNHDNDTTNDIEMGSDDDTMTTKLLISQQSSSNTDDLFNYILNSEQIDEWKGWMQIVILAYQMTDASGKSIVLAMFVQLLISSYLFLAGYSHFVYYWKTGNYNCLNFLQMLFRYNFLTISLCLIMNRNYQSYYYPPLISFYFAVVYFAMAILPPRINMSTIKDKPMHLVYLFFKFILLGTLLTTLSLSEFLFEKIFAFKLWNNLFTTSTITSSLAAYAQQLHKSDLTHNGLNQLKTLLTHDVNEKLNDGEKSLLDYLANSGCGIVGPVTLSGITLDDITHTYFHNSTSNNIYYDRNGTINDWYHRWNLDRYTILYGMCFAYLLIIIQNFDMYKTFGGFILMKKKQYQQYRTNHYVTLLCTIGLIGLVVYIVVLFLCSNKAVCDEIHPYIIVLPIFSYIILRNVPVFLRKHYSPFFSWFGRISLELFVAQYHIWLVANGHGALTIIPRMPTLNLILTTFIFICIAHELHIITNVLTPVFIPNDYKCFARNCFVYIVIIIFSSYMFSSI